MQHKAKEKPISNREIIQRIVCALLALSIFIPVIMLLDTCHSYLYGRDSNDAARWIFILLYGLIALIFGGIGLFAAMCAASHKQYKRFVYQRLHPVGHCLGCDYDLRGSIEGGQSTCPECGKPIAESKGD